MALHKQVRKVTTHVLNAMKLRGEKIAMLTAYDYTLAGILDQAKIDAILVGDSASSKLYKNGVGAAYITGKAAANTAVFNGISAAAFKKHYQPVCSNLERDNVLGKFIFSVTGIIQKSHLLKSAMLGLVIKEQGKKNQNTKSVQCSSFC